VATSSRREGRNYGGIDHRYIGSECRISSRVYSVHVYSDTCGAQVGESGLPDIASRMCVRSEHCLICGAKSAARNGEDQIPLFYFRAPHLARSTKEREHPSIPRCHTYRDVFVRYEACDLRLTNFRQPHHRRPNPA
jgi:hypothetical protein